MSESSPFKVVVADNFRYQDKSAFHDLGFFENIDSAITACQKIVDDYLVTQYKHGMTASALYASYVSFGEDPFIVGPGDTVPFSAWDYAKTRCDALSAQPMERDKSQ